MKTSASFLINAVANLSPGGGGGGLGGPRSVEFTENEGQGDAKVSFKWMSDSRLVSGSHSAIQHVKEMLKSSPGLFDRMRRRPT